MQAVFDFDAQFHKVLVYPDRVVLRPGAVMKFGGAVEKVIHFADVSDVHLKEGTFVYNGFIHFAIRDERDPSPPAVTSATRDSNTFMFGRGKNSEAAKIKDYVLARVMELNSVTTEEMVLAQRGVEAENGDKPPKRSPSPLIPQDFERFRRLTTDRNWTGIMECNGLSKILTGVGKELKVLGEHLQEGEVVFALVSGLMTQTSTSNAVEAGFNTWLGVLTDRRVLMLDHAMLTSSVDTQSIRHDRIQAVSGSQGWMFGKVTIDIGNRSIEIDNCEKEHVKLFVRLADEWINHLSEAKVGAKPAQTDSSTLSRDPIDEIKRLSELKNAGILSEEEFSKAKVAFLSKL